MECVRLALLDKMTSPEKLPFSYKIGGVEYKGIPSEFHPSVERKLVDASIVTRTYKATVKDTALELLVECVEYRDHPVWEWTAYFTNKGNEKSPVISEFYGINDVLPIGGNVTLYHNNGDYCAHDGLETTALTMSLGDKFSAENRNGRSCDRAWPYYRVTSDTACYNLAIGWPGNWQSNIELTDEGLVFKAKQACTRFYLLPGETVRGPRMLVMGFEGGGDKGINLYRRFYFDHMMSRSKSNILEPKLVSSFSGGGEEFTLASEENQASAINKLIERGLTPDIWWLDAGWYPCKDEEGVKRWVRTGKWYPDPEKFPNGLGPVGKKCRENGIQFLLWFEPERVTIKYWPEENPTEYVLKLKNSEHGWGLLDLGNPKCLEWLTDLIKKTLADGNVEIYRQDFNGGDFPVQWWLQNDEDEDRYGITENKHIQGYLKLWDDLLMDTPDLWIDSCASGGRRNDIEAMRRAVTLHPTDYGYGIHPVKQAFQKTWFEWTPYFRSSPASWDDAEGEYPEDKTKRCHVFDSYAGHCAFAPVTNFGANAKADDAAFKRALDFSKLWRRAAGYTLCSDFFCLTPVRKSNKDYFSIQFNKEETAEGVIQVIRNTRCEEESITVMPHCFEDGKLYSFEAPEAGKSFEISGDEINKNGLTFSIPKRSGIFWFYKKIDK